MWSRAGTQCLLDAASRQAWLSPAEQVEPLRERVRTAVIASLIALREQVPRIGIGEIQYDKENDAVLVSIEAKMSRYRSTLTRRPLGRRGGS